MTFSESEFLKHEIAVWGEDVVFDLLDRGYALTLTSEGYRWIAPLTSGGKAATVGGARFGALTSVLSRSGVSR